MATKSTTPPPPPQPLPLNSFCSTIIEHLYGCEEDQSDMNIGHGRWSVRKEVYSLEGTKKTLWSLFTLGLGLFLTKQLYKYNWKTSIMRSKISNFGLKSNKAVYFPRCNTIILIPKTVEAFWLGRVFLLVSCLKAWPMEEWSSSMKAKPFFCHDTLPATA